MDVRPYLSWNRRVSSRLSGVLWRLGVKANHVTFFALIAGAAGGIAFSGGTRQALLWGAAWIHFSYILDNCDGEVARLGRHVTRFGKWFDLVVDLLVDFAIWTGLSVSAWRTGFEGPLYIYLALALTGSVANLVMVIAERRKGVSTSIHAANHMLSRRKENLPLSLLDVLSHNGDAIWLIWLMALVGSPAAFLVAGSVYINALWMFRLGVNFKAFTTKRPHRVLLRETAS